MSEQERDNGQDVRNAEIRALSDDELLGSFAEAWKVGGWGELRNEILRRMSTGNSQGKECACGATTQCAGEHYYPYEAERSDGRIEAEEGADRAEHDCEWYGGCKWHRSVLKPERSDGRIEAEEGADRCYLCKCARHHGRCPNCECDGRYVAAGVSEESGDNGRKGGNAGVLPPQFNHWNCEHGPALDAGCSGDSGRLSGYADVRGPVQQDALDCQEARNGGVTQDKAKDKS